MKKIAKILTAAGLVLILAGTGITAASFAMGADPVRIGRYFENRFGVFDAAYVIVSPEDSPEESMRAARQRSVFPRSEEE